MIRATLIAAALVAAAPAAAQDGRAGASRRLGSFEFKVSPYRPNVDAEFQGGGCAPDAPSCTPYADVFGGGRKMMFKLEGARTLYRGWGSLDLGAGVGFWQARGKGRISGTSQVSADTTTLRIVPTSIHLTYRLDFLSDRLSIPLAPYGRVAFERFNWWTTKGSGGTSSFNGRSGSGATNGFSYGGGLALLLDFIDPSLAREMDRDTGINHTYLYAEVMKYDVDDFNSGSSLNLSSDGAAFGFGLLFVF